MSNYQNDYPFVFIHGFGGWGETDKIESVVHYWGTGDKNIIAHFREEGKTVVCPSCGPFNSVWDRSCEAYAQLTGTRVDYGKAHSEKYGHARYGKTYTTPMLPDWGKPGTHAKINLLGHSFGGPTVVMLSSLLSAGAEEERAVTPPDELSPLFEGGHGDLIHTVTTLSGVVNGTTLASFFGEKGMQVAGKLVLMANTMLSETQAMKWYNFHTQQWGIMPDPERINGNKFTPPTEHMDSIDTYNRNHVDHAGYEMSVETRKEINDKWTVTDPHIYYFCRSADRTYESRNHKRPQKLGGFPLAWLSGFITGVWENDRMKAYGVDRSWLPNDGFVNVPGQKAPFNQPSVDWVPGMPFEPGVWHNMPTVFGDHTYWNGIGQNRELFHAMYDEWAELFRTLPDG